MADSIESNKLSNTINPNVNSTCSSSFVSPCTPQEAYDLIEKLKNKKSKKKFRYESMFIRYANPVLSVY